MRHIAGSVGSVQVTSQLLGASYDQTGQSGTTVTAAAANTVHAQTGDLPAGLYEVHYSVEAPATAGDMTLHIRDNGNASQAEIRVQNPTVNHGPTTGTLFANLGANWDVIVVNEAAFAAGQDSSAMLTWRRLRSS